MPFADGGRPGYGLHLAVMTEPYLRWVLVGTKTVESRSSPTRIPPYGLVRCGRRAAQGRWRPGCWPFVGLARIAAGWQPELGPAAWQIIEPEYLARKQSSRYATLMTL